MATVHLGRLLGPVGFSRTVAIKRLHAHLAADPEFVSMFLDEARLAARIRHPNVVPTLDVVAIEGELFLVMEYVPGESLAQLARLARERRQAIPLPILASTMAGVLHGLHAAHEATDERGSPLGIVHRDVSPQNVLVGTDGVARVLDFGVAKAAGRVQTTREGQIKGKLSYMPPEQLRGGAVSRQTDIYAAGVMIWELVTGARLFSGDNEGVIVAKVLEGRVERPSEVVTRMGNLRSFGRGERELEALDATVLRALSMNPDERHGTARELAIELERSCPLATASEIGDWVQSIARDVLTSRAAKISEIESSASLVIGRDGDDALTVLNTKPRSDAPVAVELPATLSPGRPPPLPHRAPPTPEAAPVQALPSYAPIGMQPSSLSVAPHSSGGGGPRSAKPPLGRFASLIGLLLGVAILAGALVIRQSKRAAGAPDEIVAPDLGATRLVESAPSVTEPATAIPEEEPVVHILELRDAVDAQAPAVDPPSRPRQVPVGGGVKGAPSTKKGSAKSPPHDCATPFWYDEQGVKKYKAHCLRE